MDNKVKEDKIKLMRQYVTDARKALDKAADISDEVGVGFSWDLAYGMSGYYEPKGSEDIGWYDSETTIRSEGEWLASSQSC